jgi:hypothetical protein
VRQATTPWTTARPSNFVSVSSLLTQYVYQYVRSPRFYGGWQSDLRLHFHQETNPVLNLVYGFSYCVLWRQQCTGEERALLLGMSSGTSAQTKRTYRRWWQRSTFVQIRRAWAATSPATVSGVQSVLTGAPTFLRLLNYGRGNANYTGICTLPTRICVIAVTFKHLCSGAYVQTTLWRTHISYWLQPMYLIQQSEEKRFLPLCVKASDFLSARGSVK